MRLAKTLVASLALAALLSGCAAQQQRQQRARVANMAERVLDQAGSIGDPGRVAAADIAFARLARDEGQWTAFARYAADGAMIHTRNGPIPAAPWLAQQVNPPVSVAWTPNTVWSSCDGTLAVSFGRSQDPEGLVGSYVTVWELQSDRSYKYVYDMGAPDNPQPAPPVRDDIPEDAIIVPGMTAIEGRIADCPDARIAAPQIPVVPQSMPQSGGGIATDRTLRWSWQHSEGGNRSVRVYWVRDGAVQEALLFEAPPPLARANP